jgi:hypothetical protein
MQTACQSDAIFVFCMVYDCVGGATQAVTPDAANATKKEIPEDAMVARLVEVKFEPTPEIMLKVRSTKYRKQEESDSKPETKSEPTVEHDATLISKFGEVLVVKVASAKDHEKDAGIKSEAVMSIGVREAPQEKLTATIISIDAGNLVLMLTPKITPAAKVESDAVEKGMEEDGQDESNVEQ